MTNMGSGHQIQALPQATRQDIHKRRVDRGNHLTPRGRPRYHYHPGWRWAVRGQSMVVYDGDGWAGVAVGGQVVRRSKGGVRDGIKPLGARIAAARLAASSIAKRGKNRFHGYEYVLASDALDAARRHLSEAGVVVYPPTVTHEAREEVQTGRDRGGRTWMTTADLVYLIENADDPGDWLEITWRVRAYDTDDKGLWKALTGAWKYLAFSMLMVGGDAQDQDGEGPGPDQGRGRRQDQGAGTPQGGWPKTWKTTLGTAFAEHLRRVVPAGATTAHLRAAIMVKRKDQPIGIESDDVKDWDASLADGIKVWVERVAQKGDNHGVRDGGPGNSGRGGPGPDLPGPAGSSGGR